MLEVNEVEFCKVNVKYSAPPDVVVEKTKEALNQLRKLPIPGFRAGKATDVALKARYKIRIEEWVKREMIGFAYDEIVFETKMEPIGFPQTLDLKLNGNNFNCELLFLKKPTFELKEVKGLEIPKPHETTTQATYVESLLQELRTRYGNDVPYSDGDFVQLGDVITMDYSVLDVTEPYQSEDGKLYTVGQNLLPEFDDNIVGMAPGESREFDILIDGNKKHVNVLLHMGMKKHPAALDDELAVKVGLKDLADLRKTAEGIAGSRLKEHLNNQIAEQIKLKLIDMHKFEIPEWLVTMESQQIAERNKINLTEATDEIKSELNKLANESVRFALILDSIRRELPASDLTDQEVIDLIKNQLQGQVEDPNTYLAEMQKNGQLLGHVAKLKNEATLQYLIDNAKILE